MESCPSCRHQLVNKSKFCPHCGARLAAFQPQGPVDPLLGMVLDNKYRVLGKIGTGAMGSIYKAEDVTLGRQVALKVLHRHLITEEDHVKRFKREALAASRLQHPNCITVLGYSQSLDGPSYIVMELLNGDDLFKILADEKKLSPERVVRFSSQILAALEEAHGEGIVHRDLKPENIMVEQLRSQEDFVKVLDFGIAKLRDHGKGDGASFKTEAGTVFGTPEYMSPEQIRGEELDGRSDLYSLGVLMYQMISGTLPFTGGTVIDIATSHLTKTAEPLTKREPTVPGELAAFVTKLMNKKPSDRYESASAARQKLLKLSLKSPILDMQQTDTIITSKLPDDHLGPSRFGGFKGDLSTDVSRNTDVVKTGSSKKSIGILIGLGLGILVAGGAIAWYLIQHYFNK